MSPQAAVAPEGDLRLSGTVALSGLSPDDPRLDALRQACALLEALENERRQLDLRLATANRLDPMRVVTGRTSLDEAVEDTRALIRQLDLMLCEAADRARKGEPVSMVGSPAPVGAGAARTSDSPFLGSST
ncbi:MAG: hypothetical protein JNK53_00935 [Phycisphaerae bacterium]|nr:hypothetical protein [Phycisphaerae bacterium]